MKLDSHILRAHAGPFLFAFIVLMFIFLMQFLMRAVDWLVGKGLSIWVITELITLNLAWIVVLAVPMSVLVATLMAFGKLSSQNEITAMKASGMSLYRMMVPVVIAAAVLTYLMIQFNNKVLPETNHRLKVLSIDIRRIKPTITLEAGIFSQDLQGYSILARKTFENSNDLEGVTIYDYTDPATSVVVTATRGKVSFTPDYQRLIMDLSDGEIHQMDVRGTGPYRRMRFERHRIVMNAEGFDFERSSENSFDRGDRELSAEDMRKMVDGWRAANEEAGTRLVMAAGTSPAMIPDPRFPPLQLMPGQSVRQRAIQLALASVRTTLANVDNQLVMIEYNDQQINKYEVEIYKKYSLPAACLVFVFLGIPLGIISRRGTFGIAATLSVGFFVLYWAALMGGEKLADRGILTPWLGMWLANIVLSIFGFYLTLRMGRETPVINWTWMTRFIPAVLRSHAPSDSPNQFDRS